MNPDPSRLFDQAADGDRGPSPDLVHLLTPSKEAVGKETNAAMRLARELRARGVDVGRQRPA